MSAFLIDTHILLWAWHRPELLPRRMAAILETEATIHVSMATFWEIAIKVSAGKLVTVSDPVSRAIEQNCRIMDIHVDHVRAVEQLPLHHRDPFDRMLIAQARVEGLTMLTADRNFAAYGVDIA